MTSLHPRSYRAAVCRCILKNKQEVFFLAEQVCDRYRCPAEPPENQFRMIPLQVIGQIGLHMLTTLAEGKDGSLVKVGDLSLVRVENLNVVLALVSPPPQTSGRAPQ